jgi:hypothetical protein
MNGSYTKSLEAATRAMVRIGLTTSMTNTTGEDILGLTRTELVHVPQGADSKLFGGWGVKI